MKRKVESNASVDLVKLKKKKLNTKKVKDFIFSLLSDWLYYVTVILCYIMLLYL